MQMFVSAKASFEKKLQSPDRDTLTKALSDIPFRDGTRDPGEADYVVRQIIERTYFPQAPLR
jgi:hypothetical protein